MITENEALAAALVLRDFAGTSAADARLIDADRPRSELAADLGPFPPSCLDDRNWEDRPSFFRVLGSISGLGHLPDSIGVLATEMASLLQDQVMDDVGHPWPEATVDGRYVVLEPCVAADGTAGWMAAGRPFCPVGSLRDHPEASLLRLSTR